MLFQHGYFTGGGYTYGVYPDYFPLRLQLIALLRSHRPPSLERPFQLVEFACGQGVGLCLQAALHPHGRFTGIDLLPSHISHAQTLAAAAGLSNVTFQEADLVSLTRDDLSFGACDIAICHGLLSWVSREVQQALWNLAVTCLRPGGLFAVSYNSFPGNLAEVPFQHLVQSLQKTHPAGNESLEAAIAQFQRLRDCDAGVFQSLPRLAAFLDGLREHDPDYLPHEYNQQRWQPRFCDRVINHAFEQGFQFLGSTSPADCFDGLLPESFRPLLNDQRDPALRELMRDLLVNQSFRRDVYSRGFDPLWPQEAEASLRNLRLIRMIDLDQLERPDLFNFPMAFGVVQGNPSFFLALLRAMGDDPVRLAELPPINATHPMPLPELLQNLALLLSKGLIAQVAPEVDPLPSQALNRVLVEKVRCGAPYRCLAVPRIGAALHLAQLDLLCLEAWLRGERGPSLLSALQTALSDLRRGVSRDGVPVPNADLPVFLNQQVQQFEQRVLPSLQRLGAVA